MLNIKAIHHIAIICSNYQKSKQFYIDILGLKPGIEIYRKERDSMKLDLYLDDRYLIELFSFPAPPKRVQYPEATGLRHLAFAVDSVENTFQYFKGLQVDYEEVRIDEHTGKRFFFIQDPDALPIEFYEI